MDHQVTHDCSSSNNNANGNTNNMMFVSLETKRKKYIFYSTQ